MGPGARGLRNIKKPGENALFAARKHRDARQGGGKRSGGAKGSAGGGAKGSMPGIAELPRCSNSTFLDTEALKPS